MQTQIKPTRHTLAKAVRQRNLLLYRAEEGEGEGEDSVERESRRQISKPSGKTKDLAICSESGKFPKSIRHLVPYHYILYGSGQDTAMTPQPQGFIKTEV